MEYFSGNIFIRVPNAPMKAGQEVLGHAHNFDHTTVCLAGALRVSLLDVLEVDVHGNPLRTVEVEQHAIEAGAAIPWMLILAGRWHSITALVDGTRYGCFYSHQRPQAVNVNAPGDVPVQPLTMRDESGALWFRVDENITQDSQAWAAAYR